MFQASKTSKETFKVFHNRHKVSLNVFITFWWLVSMSSRMPLARNSNSGDIFPSSTFKKKNTFTPYFITVWCKKQDDSILTNLVALYLRIKILPKITE